MNLSQLFNLPEPQFSHLWSEINNTYLPCYDFFLKFVLFIYFWLHWVFVAARGLFSSCGERGLLFVAGRGLPVAVASLVAEHGL